MSHVCHMPNQQGQNWYDILHACVQVCHSDVTCMLVDGSTCMIYYMAVNRYVTYMSHVCYYMTRHIWYITYMLTCISHLCLTSVSIWTNQLMIYYMHVNRYVTWITQTTTHLYFPTSGWYYTISYGRSVPKTWGEYHAVWFTLICDKWHTLMAHF